MGSGTHFGLLFARVEQACVASGSLPGEYSPPSGLLLRMHPIPSMNSFSVLRPLAAATCGLLVALSANSASAQERFEFPAGSPAATIKQRVGLTDVEVIYSRPSVKGRKIFGDLVKFGEIWRTGANSNTKITFSDAVKFGDKDIAAGTYALFTIPGENEWTVTLSTDTKQWGAGGYKKETEAARITVKPVALAATVESFQISFDDLATGSATLLLEWEKTRVPVKLGFATGAKVDATIEKALASGKDLPGGFYAGAATFYFENGKDPKKALEWIEKAYAANPKAWWLLRTKGQIQIKLGDKAGAIATLEKAVAMNLADETPFKTEAEADRKTIESLKK